MATPISTAAFAAADDSEFVLDDGLDDGLDNEMDADVLNFETLRNQQAEADETAAAAALTPQRPTSEKKIPRAQTPQTPSNVEGARANKGQKRIEELEEQEDDDEQQQQKKGNSIMVPQVANMASIASMPIGLSGNGTAELEITGLPVGCNRTHLEALVGNDALKGIRLGGIEPNREVYGPTKITVSIDAVERVLSLREPVVRGKPVVVVEMTAGKVFADTINDMRKHLPMKEINSAAEKFTAALEAGGEQLDELNRKYEITNKATEAAEAVSRVAKDLDEKVGASKGASAVAEAASVAAKEMDDSWRVTERAREALNAALTDDRTAPAARMFLGAIDSPKPEHSSGRRKDYLPSAERRNPDTSNDNINSAVPNIATAEKKAADDKTKTKLEF